MDESNRTISGLWHGPFSVMEQLCIKSFLTHGHEFHLYCYEQIPGLPDGTVVKDAAEIMPWREYKHACHIADHFRVKFLYERGGFWTDMDVVCMRPLDFEFPYLFTTEDKPSPQRGPQINNAVMKAPAKSDYAGWMASKCESSNPEDLKWVSLGPVLTTEGTSRFDLQKWIVDPAAFCVIPWWDYMKFIDDSVHLDSFQSVYAFHLWRYMWTLNKIPLDLNTGLYGELRKLYGV